MRIRISNRVRKVVLWGGLLVLAILGGGLWFAYAYITDSDTLAGLIRREAPRYLPGSKLIVDRVRVRPLVGDVNLTQVKLWQRIDGLDFLTIRIPWVHIRNDFRELIHGQFVPREVVVAQPSLRICRRKDGTWNLQGLLADPFPGDPKAAKPVVLIQKGTIELVDPQSSAASILRDVTVRVEPTAAGPYRFEGSAQGGDAFDRLALEGTFDPANGRLVLAKGDLTGLAISEALGPRLPAELRPLADRIGLKGGEADLSQVHLTYDPRAMPKAQYSGTIRLRSGTWNCPKIPFPLNDVAVDASVKDGRLTIDRAEGINGKTTVRARGSLTVDDPERGPLDVRIDVVDLELDDDRLRKRTPPEFDPLWDEYLPRGRVSAAFRALREEPGGRVGFGMTVDCHDVAIQYRHFPYPVDRINGQLKWEGERITLDLNSVVGGESASVTGTIDQPGPQARVVLNFKARALPIDKTLLDAMPPNIRQIVDQFQPKGSVRVTRAVVERQPPTRDDPRIDKVTFDADLDLAKEGHCEITWAGLPYPIINLTGRLEIHPNRCVFKEIKGLSANALATIEGDGSFDQLGPNRNRVVLHLKAAHLPFDPQLQRSLPQAWKTTWDTLNPRGSSFVEAKIRVEPGHEHYHLEVVPEPETRVQLEFVPTRGPGVPRPSEPLVMPPMDQVSGRFVYDDGTVTMTGVRFQFRGAPVQFASGAVRVMNNGQFALNVADLYVTGFRLDDDLRKLMPPVMAQFSRRIDEGKTFTIKTDLGLGWSGKPGEPAWCSWKDGLVIFTGNTIQAGIPLDHLQGQLEQVKGRFDGRDLESHGILNLDSVSLLGQQVTRLRASFDVGREQAELSHIQGTLLGGEVAGQVKVGLETTPRFAADLSVREADLERFALTMPGRQTFRGLVSGRLAIEGLGYDLRTLRGEGEAHVTDGELGELPVVLRLFKFLKLAQPTKTAFDSADVNYRVQDGQAILDPIRLTGDAFSLYGRGTASIQSVLNLRLHVVAGRNERRIPLVGGALREASAQFFDIHVFGPAAYPKFKLEPLHGATDIFRRLGGNRDEAPSRR